eukprot:TRINITY_DN1603_c0_g1_i1.p1 TRINITY_DN1603_c0_g1~~TRINITY_DN1603_c0_g1_i1.p1  ORF type:complete len:417 (-),score=117.60 TRINITY_DN1603_c0_g1_i1:429-1592(-)
MGLCGSKPPKKNQAEKAEENPPPAQTKQAPPPETEKAAPATPAATPAPAAAAPVEQKTEAKPPPAAAPEPTPPAPQAQPDDGSADEETDGSESDLSVLEGIQDFYEFGEEIGQGGFSVVYKATSKKSGEAFAIKRIQRGLEGDEGDGMDIEQLKREIHIMKKLNHPNVLKLFEVFEEEDYFFLVTEFVEGKELFDRIVERGAYSERDAANIVVQILEAVEYLHSNGIAHRDLKPENLLSSVKGDKEIIKILDFGFSKKFGEEKLVTSVGTPGYVAPEVLTSESYDMSVDMWSIGVIIYILLCGFPPFFGETPPELFKKIIECKYDFDDQAWDEVSDQAKDLIRHLLVKDPKQRFTATQCLQHEWIKSMDDLGNTTLPASNKIKTMPK